jgi:formylglycine-generating enzyme required for sulfatase activity
MLPNQKRMGIYDDIIIIYTYIIEKNPRLLRGGSFFDRPADIRSAYRVSYAPATRGTGLGFRPFRTYP